MSKYRNKFPDEREQNFPEVVPKNATQDYYLRMIDSKSQVIVTGPAGTGKTFLAASRAADLLRRRKVAKIVLTRPNVASGRSLGAFPGTLEEKMAPWVVPFTDVIRSRMPQGMYDLAMKNKQIEIVPFEVMRGRTFNDAFVILDEAQNTTPVEMKMFLTRIGDDSTTIINGDIDQTDLKETSGLKKIIQMVEKYNMDIPHIQFGMNDIVRSDVCALWIKAFHKEKV
jgi:phosphate starvation-inducible PhoH-like protein